MRVDIKKGYQYKRWYVTIDGFEHASKEVEIYDCVLRLVLQDNRKSPLLLGYKRLYGRVVACKCF